jgi:signal transduction histidine kinase
MGFNGFVFSGLNHLAMGKPPLQLHWAEQREILSLGQALAAVPNELGLFSAIRFRVLVKGRERELSDWLRDEIYRIGREAIINAIRHSCGKVVEAEIEYRATGLSLFVRDNGCGIDPQQLQWGRNRHRGLQGMRERAERIGGRLRILSRVALGTEVELCVPGRDAFVQSEIRAAS